MRLSIHLRRFIKMSYIEVNTILQNCTQSKTQNVAKQIHAILITSNFRLSRVSLDAKLLGVYASCGNLRYACHLFDRMPSPNVFAVNWMIWMMAFRGEYYAALWYFSLVRETGNLPNGYTFSMVLKACVGLLDLSKGREVHGGVIKVGFGADVVVCNALLDLYCKCGEVLCRRRLFDMMVTKNVVSWTVMISGYGKVGKVNEAIVLFERMKMAGFEPNRFTWNALIAGYAQRGDLHGSLELLSRMEKEGLYPDVVSWNALTSGFARSCRPAEALILFKEMLNVGGIRPNHVTLTGLLPVCGLIRSAQTGRELHGLIYRLKLDDDVYVASALIDMYSKCGNVKSARDVFEMISIRNVSVWNAMIGCLRKHGIVDEALLLFEKMLEQGCQPDEVTLVSVLSACSHGRLVEKGMQIFRSMREKYQVWAGKEHYACVVDLLSRAGKLEEALELVKSMTMEPTESIVGAFVNGCKMHRRRDLAEEMAEFVLGVHWKDPGVLVTFSNMYAAEEEWLEVKNIRKLMKSNTVYKKPGSSHSANGGGSVDLRLIEVISNMDDLSEEFPG